ncbi:MAG: FMN-binding protein [Caldiserica bacterium]|nr:FMN-binding protein [Caldisericota bacterium]
MKTWQMIKLGLILAIYTIVGCVGLAVVYNSTSKTIAARQASDLQNALQEVFPSATSFTPTDKVTSSSPAVIFQSAFTAEDPSGLLGMAVQVQGSSYGGATVLLVGVSNDGTITGVKVMENKDTPGLGANAANPAYYVDKATTTTFPGQFTGKKVTDPFVVKKDVIPITSATITSRSIASLVQFTGKAIAAALNSNSSSQTPVPVVPPTDVVRPSSRPVTSSVSGVSILETLVTTRGETIVSASAKARAMSYDGDVTVLVAVSTSGTILNVQVLEISDSQGLPVLAPDFAQQFVGKKTSAALAVGSDITAVTGATFSSRGTAQLIKATADALFKALSGGGL